VVAVLELDKIELQMDIASQREIVAEWYEYEYFPDDAAQPYHIKKIRARTRISKALKFWYDERNNICHKSDYVRTVAHAKFRDRSMYILDLLYDIRRSSYDHEAAIQDFKAF